MVTITFLGLPFMFAWLAAICALACLHLGCFTSADPSELTPKPHGLPARR